MVLKSLDETLENLLKPSPEVVLATTNGFIKIKEDEIIYEKNTFTQLFSKIKPSFYKKTLHGTSLNQYKDQGFPIIIEGKNYFLESDSYVQKKVLGFFRKKFEKRYNGNLTVTDKDFITSREDFYKNKEISDLPILQKVKNKNVSENAFLTNGYENMVNMTKYLENQSNENKTIAISSLFESLYKMHKKDFIVGDPSTYIVQYVQNENKSYFTNLRFTRKSKNPEDYAREISQFIISVSLNSKLSINEIYGIFKKNYEISDNIVNAMEHVTQTDDKKVNAFSNMYRNISSILILGKTWNKFKKDRKEIYELMKKN